MWGWVFKWFFERGVVRLILSEIFGKRVKGCFFEVGRCVGGFFILDKEDG